MDEKFNKEEIWSKCLLFIKNRIQETAFQTWFDGVQVSSITNEDVTLLVPNKFHYEWLESKYRTLIDEAINSVTSKSLIINYTVPITSKSSQEIPSFSKRKNDYPRFQPRYNKTKIFNSQYTFNSFIEGKDNQFARAACESVSDAPGTTPFNPLLIYSSTGLGKTHLLQAIGNKVLRKYPDYQITYLTSERFMLEFISSIQKNKSTDFANQYRSSDILLIDDVQFFEGKEQTQEQFFHLFNDLFEKGKQIVLTVDKHPNELSGIKERLVSRFQSGLMVDIQAPDLETRIAILMNEAEQNNINLSYKITEFIATSITSDIRKMKGVLVRLLAISSLKQVDINMKLVQGVVREMIGDKEFHTISIKEISKYITSKLGVNERLVRGKSRRQEIALARQIIMYFSRELTSLPLSKIGAQLGKRDHSTVVHACKLIEKKINDDDTFKNQIDDYLTALSN
jgi:chromosomal replication initiator protein